MSKQSIPIVTLRWALGLVVVVEALHFVLSPGAAAHFARTGLPLWIRPVLGWMEVITALLFLAPATRFVGGYALLLIFAAAVALHLRLGDYGVGALIVYATAIIVCMADRGSQFGGKTA